MTAIIAGGFAVLGTAVMIFSFRKFAQGQYTRGIISVLSGLLLLTISSLVVVLMLSIQGYHALTREESAATVRIVPAGPQAFVAVVQLSDGTEQRHILSGDQFYIDAQILKWKPVANLMGLHTAYELDRLAGRYLLLEDEIHKPRTVVSLKGKRPLDLFTLRQRYSFLAPIVDAEYGSATFTVANEGTYDVRVSTSGLLVRPK